MSTPEIEAILTELSEQCCSVLACGQPLDQRRVDELTSSLSVNGWLRHNRGEPPLKEQLARRVRSQIPAQSIHRASEIEGVVDSVVSSYRRASTGASAPHAF